MKLLIASDIHGSAEHCRSLLQAFSREGAHRLVLLGDILYHGPRNPLPDGYNPAEVAKLLGSVKEKILCIRGNCDSEVDGMVLPFPLLESGFISDGIADIYLAHGHREEPSLPLGSVYISGHTHVPLSENCGYYRLNPGSVSLPKEESQRGYILYENGVFLFRTLAGETYDELSIR